MRIVIDLQGAQSSSRYRGIGRYSLQFTQAFARLARHHQVVVLLNDALPEAIGSIREALCGIVVPEQIAIWSALPVVHFVDPENDGRRRISELIREAVLASLAPDLVILTSLFEGAADDAVTSIGRYADLPTATILYDLIPLEAGADYLADPLISRWYREKLEHLARSDHFFAISPATSDAARKLLQIPVERITDIGAGIEDGFADGAAAADMISLGVSRPYFLYVSGIDRRKNHSRLIQAWGGLPTRIRNTHQLVLVGHMNPDHQDELREMGKQAGLRGNDLVIAGNLSEPELKHLYASCLCLVFPSTQEGFGLPVLEAMAFGKPVIASDVPVIRAVHGQPDALFDPLDADAIAATMSRVVEDPRFREGLIRHSIDRVRDFSWSAVAQRALDWIDATPMASRTASPERAGAVRRTLIDRLRASDDLRASGAALTATAIARSFRPDDRPRLLVDISELVTGDARTGIQRVVRTILSEWLANPPGSWRIVPIYANLENAGFREARAFADRFLGSSGDVRGDEPIEVWPGDRFLALDLQSHVLPAQHATLQAWRDRGVIAQAVVYDLLPVTMPENFRDGWCEAHERWLATIASLDGAISISRAVATEFAAWRSANGIVSRRPFRNGWFHLGADLEATRPSLGLPHDAEALLAGTRARPTILMVGTLEPRKAHEEALAAFESVWSRDGDAALIIIGQRGWNMDALFARLADHPERGRRLSWFADVSDEWLEIMYRNCAGLLLASRGEGFGLPIIEAARRDIPLLLRDIPVFREVAGDHATYFGRGGTALSGADLSGWLAALGNGSAPRSRKIALTTWSDAAKRLFELATGLADEGNDLID